MRANVRGGRAAREEASKLAPKAARAARGAREHLRSRLRLHDATNQAVADTKVGKALAYSWDLCTKAHEAALRDFTSTPCAAAGDRPATPIDGGCMMFAGGAGERLARWPSRREGGCSTSRS